MSRIAFTLQLNYDFNAGARHNLSLGANISDKKDNTLFKRDSKTTATLVR